MSTENIIYTLLEPNRIYNDHEISFKSGIDLRQTRQSLSVLTRGLLVDLIKQVKVKNKVYRVYQTRQKRLFR